MTIQFYSTDKKRLVEYKPRQYMKTALYTCGPTVYSTPHIGNFRTYITWDFLVRFLRFKGYEVNHVMNITDVGHLTDDEVLDSGGEDKMEKASKKESITVWDVAKKYEKEFFKISEALHIARPNTVCRATEHIEDMITMVNVLIEKGHAYVTPSGVYFDISSFEEYGALSGNKLDALEAGASGRVEDLGDKRSAHDFALWVTGKEQAMMWDSPWGKGFPGWHVECSAMSQKYLGEELDIHTGGTDNIFPHHECEIAQSECATGHEPFSRYWLHTGLMTIEGEKMSKSKGNAWNLKDIQEMGYDSRTVRYTLLKSHYRSSADISKQSFAESKKNLQSIDRFVHRLRHCEVEGEVSNEVSSSLNSLLQGVIGALAEDLATPVALGYLFEFINKANAAIDMGVITTKEAQATLRLLITFDEIFQCLLGGGQGDDIPAAVVDLAEQRMAAKHAKDYAASDGLRDQIKAEGYDVEDTSEGYRVVKR